MGPELTLLLATAASIGFIHTLIGPDHYIPFVAMARAGSWSLKRTMGITLVCGIGHVLGSLTLGFLGIALGWAVGGLEWVEGMRGDIASWLLLGFGIAYMAWGVRRAIRNRPHTHWHKHAGDLLHEHTHTHDGSHVHVHEAEASSAGTNAQALTPWVLFTIFVFGPCEPLIPVLMYPAAEGSWWGVGMVASAFGVVTIVTMMAAVGVGYLGMSRLPFGPLERYSHALAGFALVACGLAIRLGL